MYHIENEQKGLCAVEFETIGKYIYTYLECINNSFMVHELDTKCIYEVYLGYSALFQTGQNWSWALRHEVGHYLRVYKLWSKYVYNLSTKFASHAHVRYMLFKNCIILSLGHNFQMGRREKLLQPWIWNLQKLHLPIICLLLYVLWYLLNRFNFHMNAKSFLFAFTWI